MNANTIDVTFDYDGGCNVTFPMTDRVITTIDETWGCGVAERFKLEVPGVRLVPRPRLDNYFGGTFGLLKNEHLFAMHSEMFAAGDTTHEIVQLDTQWTHPLKDFLVDLDFLDTSHIRRKYLEVNKDGKVLGIPIKPNQQVMFYRQDLFAKHGLEYRGDSYEAWEESLLELKKREHAAGNTDFYPLGIAFGDSTNRITFNWITVMSGVPGAGQIVESDGRVTVNNPAAVSALVMWARWYGTLIDPAVLTMNRHTFRVNYLNTNKSAVMLGWAADANHYLKFQAANPSWGFDVQIGPIPGPTGAGTMGVWSGCLSKHTREMDAAKKAFEVLASPQGVIERSFRMWNADYNTDLIRNNATLWARYCKLNPMICSSKEKWPEFWERAVYRPSEVCGTLYDQCTETIFAGVTDVVLRQKNPVEAVQQMERDLKVLLGQLDPDELNSGEEWTPSRISLIIVCCVGALLLVAIGTHIYTSQKSVRGSAPGCSIPISAMLGMVVASVLVVTVSVIVSVNSDTMKSISEDLAEKIRMKSLLSLREAVLGGFEAQVHSEDVDLVTLKTQTVAKVTFDVTKMRLDGRSLVLLIDREPPHRLLVSSNSRLQKKGVSLENLMGPEVSEHVKELLRAAPQWRTGSRPPPSEDTTYRFTVDGEDMSGNIKVVQNEVRNTHFSENKSHRKLDWLLAYITPDRVILQEANEALDKSLDLSLQLGVVAVVLCVLASVAITSPLVQLAKNIELVRVLDLAGISHQSPGCLTEMAVLIQGFKSMCARMDEYVSFMPKTMFAGDESEEAEEAEVTPSTARSRSRMSELSNTTGASGMSVLQQKLTLRMQARRGAAMIATITTGGKEKWDEGGAFARLVTLTENMRNTTLHSFSTLMGNDILVSCGVASAGASPCEAILRMMFGMKAEAGAVDIGLVISSEAGKVVAGNVGSSSSRGFIMSGDLPEHLLRVKKINLLLSSKKNIEGLVLAGKQLCERSDAEFTIVDVMRTQSSSLMPVCNVTGRKKDGAEEWMYELEQQENQQSGLEKALTTIAETKSLDGLADALKSVSDSQTPLASLLTQMLMPLRGAKFPTDMESVMLLADMFEQVQGHQQQSPPVTVA